MAHDATLTIRLEKSVKDRLASVASRTRRSKSFLAAEAIEEFLNVQEWQERRIREALASAERGEGVPHEDVVAWVDSWGTDDELPMPKA